MGQVYEPPVDCAPASALLAERLDADTLAALLKGELLAIRVAGFETPERCAEVAATAEGLAFSAYRNVSPVIDRVGVTVFEYERIGKEEYFRAVEKASEERRRVVQGHRDPVDAVMSVLADAWPGSVGLAQEPGFGAYFAGLFRRIEEGALVHIDYAPREQPTWAVGEVLSQLVWNLYYSVPQDPGVVRIWNRQFQPGDEVYALPNSYGYREEVVAGLDYVDVRPQVGDLLMINTRCYHQVEKASGMRIACTSAIGLTRSNDLVLWS